MSENSTAFSEEEEQWIQAQRARAAKRNKKVRRGDEPGAMNINSMMDIMVIILVFLLKSYGDEPIKVIGEDLKAPDSATELTPEDMTTITLSQKSIMVNNKKAVDIKSGAVDKSQKKGGEASLYIQPLFDTLTEAINRKKREMKMIKQDYKPQCTITVSYTHLTLPTTPYV